MDDWHYRNQVTRIKHLTSFWSKKMGLSNITLRYVYDRTGASFDAALGTPASCGTDWRYEFATITFNMPSVKGLSNKELEQTVVHEFCHIYLDEVTRGADGLACTGELLAHEERVVTQLAKAFIRVKGA